VLIYKKPTILNFLDSPPNQLATNALCLAFGDPEPSMEACFLAGIWIGCMELASACALSLRCAKLFLLNRLYPSSAKLVAVFKPIDGAFAHATFGYAGMYGALAGMSSKGIVVTEANLEENRITFFGYGNDYRLNSISHRHSVCHGLCDYVGSWRTPMTCSPALTCGTSRTTLLALIT